AVARRSGLPAAQSIFDHAVAHDRVTPRMAQLRAFDLAASDGLRAAIDLVGDLSRRHPRDAAWALTDARVRLALGDESAADAWKRLTETFPDDIAVQSAALAEAPALIGDRAAQSAVVDRLRELCGDTGN